MDDNGHGTHVAGIIGAVGNNGVGVTGVNWQTNIASLKFLRADGGGFVSNAIAAMEYIIANDIRVSNHSWKTSGYSQELYNIIDASQAIGHIVVAAAGNEGKNSDRFPLYPAAFDLPNVISVAATDAHDALASFSNYGAVSVDLGAPGYRVYSTYVEFPSGEPPQHTYRLLSGTSMAAPHVAGVVALVWSKYPQMTWQAVRDKLFWTVRGVDSLMCNPPFEGVRFAGVVDAWAALDCNFNGIPDDEDISGGTSQDCTGNWIPDECEPDCNGNSVADSCDIASGTSEDVNGDGIPDECQTPDVDCNMNGVRDECEVDCDGDGIPDECQLDGNDCNDNGVPDNCEPNHDCNENGVQDICDIASGFSQDVNGNQIPDECEPSACCFDDATTCVAGVDPTDCVASGGGVGEPGSNCVPVEGQVCCMSDGTCNTQIHSACCPAVGGTRANGDGCSPLAACCPPGTETQCIDTLESCCEAIGGTFNSTQVCDPPGGPSIYCNPGTQSTP